MRPPPSSPPPPPDRRRDYSPPPTSGNRSSGNNNTRGHYRDYDDPSYHHHDSYSSHRSPPPRPPPADYSSSRPRSSVPYKILCISNLSSKISDGSIRDQLVREFSRFGDVSVRVCFDGVERIAYVYFRCYEEAREARHSKYRMILFDREVVIEPIYERGQERTSSTSSSSARRRTPSPSEYGGRRPPSPPKRYDGRPLTLPPHMRNQQLDPPPPSSSSRYAGNNNERRSDYGSRDHTRDYGRDYPPPPPRDYYRDESSRHHSSSSSNNHHHHSSTAVGNNSSSSANNASSGQKSGQQRESKKEKFPNYLHHIAPEEDDKATRTLFVGNLEVSISDGELRRIFERYGVVEDIDVKRPPPGQGNAYAFIKFLNLDMAHRAKVEMSGQYIGKFQCKIGYGKATPTTRIWVGGLGSWTSLAVLEREFDRFGAIRKIDFVRGDNHAYIQYDSIDAAQAACQEMRGFPLGGQDKRLRVDFADPGPYSTIPGGSPSRSLTPSRDPLLTAGTGNVTSPSINASIASGDVKTCDGESGVIEKNGGATGVSSESGNERTRIRDSDVGEGDDPPSKKARTSSNGDFSAVEPVVQVSDSVTSISELVKVCPPAWGGSLILKNSAFPTKFLLCSGDVSLVDLLVTTSDSSTTVRTVSDFSSDKTPIPLRITQRLKLEPSKLGDLTRRLSQPSTSGSSFCILLAVPSSSAPVFKEEGVSQRPLKNLVVYLKQKEAAGVISVNSSAQQPPQSTSGEGDGDGDGGNTSASTTGIKEVLYVFPPCPFSHELIRKIAPNFNGEMTASSSTTSTKEVDYLVVVIIRG